jgi:UDP-3-O-[3-hydroxymyristoyl] glucosamine N-acyltransferase
LKIKDIAEQLDAKVIGDENLEITHLCKIDQATIGGLSFLANKKYDSFLANTEASAVFVTDEFSDVKSKATLLVVKDPYVTFSISLKFFFQLPIPFDKGIDKTAKIHPSASIGKDVHISSNVYIGQNTIIGDNAVIYPNVVILEDSVIGKNVRLYPNCSIRENSIIGNNVTIHNGAVIGSDGFGFAPNPPKGFEKIYQIGIVRIEDDVEIGANTCIDRATIGETVIGKGTKLDNLIQVGHNVIIGNHNVFAGMTAIAGSTTIGDWNFVGGHSAFPGHITVGSRNKIAGKSAPTGNIGSDSTLMGVPAIPDKEFKRNYISQKRIPDLIKQVKSMKKEIEDLQKKLDEI